MQSEKRRELTKQIVIRLKEVIQDMSDAEVLQKMAEAGEQTSIATIRRNPRPHRHRVFLGLCQV